MNEDHRRLTQEALKEAVAKHPNWPTNFSEMALILIEEAGEVAKAVNDHRESGGSIEAIETELYQTAAMCYRMLDHLRAENDPLLKGVKVEFGPEDAAKADARFNALLGKNDIKDIKLKGDYADPVIGMLAELAILSYYIMANLICEEVQTNMQGEKEKALRHAAAQLLLISRLNGPLEVRALAVYDELGVALALSSKRIAGEITKTVLDMRRLKLILNDLYTWAERPIIKGADYPPKLPAIQLSTVDILEEIKENIENW